VVATFDCGETLRVPAAGLLGDHVTVFRPVSVIAGPSAVGRLTTGATRLVERG